MSAVLDTGGERVMIECSLPWVAEMLVEAAGPELRADDGAPPAIVVYVEDESEPFDTRGWQFLTRGAWRRDGEVIIENACTSGFDVRVSCMPRRAIFTFRWRPPARERAAARLLRSRFHLLARAVLTQYPVLWWAARQGRAPLHASACTIGEASTVLTAAAGVGRSTLILGEVRAGAYATGDNIAVADGSSVWGLVEPLRSEYVEGRRTQHGRREAPMPRRVPALQPDRLIVLERGHSGDPALSRCTTDAAARALVLHTYMAGELRRFWDFAAILTAGIGSGPLNPPVAEVAFRLAASVPCFRLTLAHPRACLSELAYEMEIPA